MLIFFKGKNEKDIVLKDNDLWLVDSAIHLVKFGRIQDIALTNDYFCDLHLNAKQITQFEQIIESLELIKYPMFTTGKIADRFYFNWNGRQIKHYETYITKPLRNYQIAIPFHLYKQYCNQLKDIVIWGLSIEQIDEITNFDNITALNFTV